MSWSRCARRSRHADVITARVTGIDHARRAVTLQPTEGEPYELQYDELVVALGSISRTLPIPGLAENAMAFKQIEEAIALHNHALDRLDAGGVHDRSGRPAKALTFVFVGGGYAGVEALAETEDMLRSATRYYPRRHRRLNSASCSSRPPTASSPRSARTWARYTVERLRQRGIDVRLNTLLKSAVDKHVVLSDGEEFDADTIVWTAGVKANPVARDQRPAARRQGPDQDPYRPAGRGPRRCLGCRRQRRRARPHAPGRVHLTECSARGPPGQGARRQHHPHAARRSHSKDYRHKHVGSVASLGLHKGVAQVYGVKLRGFPAWFMHRTYHMTRMPTFNKKVRVVLDWTLALFFRRDVASLGRLHHPREDFERANT